MDLIAVIRLIGGLAFFLYGMGVLSHGLERIGGGRLETALRKITSSRFQCLLLGAGITAAIQSSSAVTVMLVGLVNSGLMDIGQTVGVIMGSNIGTTMTAWILTLVGIESDNIWISLLKPENFSLVFAFAGVMLIMAGKKQKHKDIGDILVGFAVLMFGMKLMSDAVKPLAALPAFAEMLTAFQNPLFGVLAGTVVTAVLQSSSASVGILQALALTGAISYGAAIPIIMGQNIGTCVTAAVSSIGVSSNAKKVAVVHTAFNLIGSAVCLAIYCALNAAFHLEFAQHPVDAVDIAAIHTGFNVATTFMLLPFTSQLVALANHLLPAPAVVEEETNFIDPRLLDTPSVAIAECDNLAAKMSALAGDTLRAAIGILGNYQEDGAKDILNKENLLDKYEDELGTTLVQISSRQLSERDSLKVSKILHVIGNFERMGDHAVNLLDSARELNEKGLVFSEAAQKEISVLTAAIREILEMTEKAYAEIDLDLAMDVEPLEQTIDGLVMTIHNRHVARLQTGECSIELGFILSDVLGNLERISDHCSNVALTVLELSQKSYKTHRYLKGVSKGKKYQDAFKKFGRKYALD